MLDKNIGHVKNVKFDPETKNMEVTFVVTDNKFKKKLLRDLSLSGFIELKGDKILFTGNKEGNS
jgi:sporulation protein YlmC with PRC-barrel domain